MQHLIPLSPLSVTAGRPGPSLLGAGADCQLRLVRGGAGGPGSAPFDRFCFVLAGAPVLRGQDAAQALKVDALVFAPARSVLDLAGEADSLWLEILVTPDAGAAGRISTTALHDASAPPVRVVEADRANFEGSGFAHQALIDRASGSRGVKINLLEVQPGSGSPDFHIHRFDQIYLVLEGEMRVDIGKTRMTAGPMTLVYLPAGVVHRNFNAGPGVERHISLLVPEPAEGAIFDYAVEILDREAELMTQIPERMAVLSA